VVAELYANRFQRFCPLAQVRPWYFESLKIAIITYFYLSLALNELYKTCNVAFTRLIDWHANYLSFKSISHMDLRSSRLASPV